MAIRQLKTNDKDTPGLLVATFEMCRFSDTVSNVCIYEKNTKKVSCYVASAAGADAISSFLLHFIEQKVKNEAVQEFHFYCAPTSENFVTCAIVLGACKLSVKINVRYFEQGPSQNESSATNLSLLYQFMKGPSQSADALCGIIENRSKFRVIRAEDITMFNFSSLCHHLHLLSPGFYVTAKELLVNGNAHPLVLKCRSVSWQYPLSFHRSLTIDFNSFSLPTL